MLRFAFKPRHPVTKVAFTADGRELVTAQPFTGIAVRSVLSGDARWIYPTSTVATFLTLAVEQRDGLIAGQTERGALLVDPRAGCAVSPHPRPDVSVATERFRLQWHDIGSNLHRLVAGRAPFESRSRGVRVAMSTVPRALLYLSDGGQPQLTCPRTGYTLVKLNSPVRLRHIVSGRIVIAFSPDGNKLVLGDGESLRVFGYADCEPRFCETDAQRPLIHPLFTLERPDPTTHGTFADKQAEHWLPPVAFDHAGRTLFTLGLRNRVQRIDLATGGVICGWGWRCEPIRSLAVAPDDLTAAAGCQRGEVVLWDLE